MKKLEHIEINENEVIVGSGVKNALLSKKLIDKCVWPLIHLTSDDMFDILKDATDLTKQNQVDYLTLLT